MMQHTRVKSRVGPRRRLTPAAAWAAWGRAVALVGVVAGACRSAPPGIVLPAAYEAGGNSASPRAAVRPVAEAPFRGEHFQLRTTVRGRPEMFLLDLGAVPSFLRQADMASLHLLDAPRDVSHDTSPGGTGPMLGATVTWPLDSLSIGTSIARSVMFLPAPVFTLSGADGLLGTTVLHHYDVEADGPARVMRLYAPDGSPGGTVRALGYTPEDCAGGRVDTTQVSWGFARPPITANGRALAGYYDSGAPVTIMSWEAARLLGLTPESPSVRRLPPDSATRWYDGPTPTWQAAGVVLTVGRHQLPPMPVRIVGHITDGHDGEPRLNPGTDALRPLRLLVAYSTGQVCVRP